MTGSEGGVRTRGGLLPLTQRLGILVQLEWPSEKGRLGYVQLRGGQAVGAESATQSWAGPEGKQAATCNFHTLGPSQGPLRVNFVSELSLWVGEAISLSFRFFFHWEGEEPALLKEVGAWQLYTLSLSSESER